MRGDEDARLRVQRCLGEVVRGWLGRHPDREAPLLFPKKHVGNGRKQLLLSFLRLFVASVVFFVYTL